MNSWRVSSQVSPTAVRKPIAASHSGSVGADLADEVVQVGHDGGEHFPQARVLGRGEAVEHLGGRVAHQSLSMRSALPCAIFARSDSLIGAWVRNSVAAAMSSNG